MRPVFNTLLGVVLLAFCSAACSKTSDKEPRDAGLDGALDAANEAGSTSCEFNGRTYELGEEYCSNDNCNVCTCEQGDRSLCTTVGCLPDRDAGFPECKRGQRHLVGASSATTLAIYGDGFRWLELDCETSNQDVGLWSETDGTITLTPAPSREDFAWPGGTRHTELQIEIKPDGWYVLPDKSQRWDVGARCPVCKGADAGAETSEWCMNPWANCSEVTFECKARQW